MAGNDWELFLEEMGLTQEQMDRAAASMPPPKKESNPKYFISTSEVNGSGVFAKQDMVGMLGLLRDGEEWYAAGRYANHSPSPNAIPIKFEDKIIMYGEVKKGEEITLNYRDMRRLIERS